MSGKAEVFAFQIKQAVPVVVREGKRLPFRAVDPSVFNISLGAGAAVQEVEGSTVPESWNKTVDATLALQKRPAIVLVLGQADSGKSSFCTYLVNRLVSQKCRVSVLDGDLGQSDIGPAGTVGYGTTAKPITELYNLKLENACFIGVTSPIEALQKAVEGLAAMEKEVCQRGVDFVVVNTDGWVSGEFAVKYKTALIKELKPDVIVGIQVQNELAELVVNLQETPPIVIEPSPALNQRTPEKRKILREMTYARYLKNAKLQNYPITQLTVEPRRGLPKNQMPEKGLLIGLYGRGNKFLGIGILREINQTRKALKVQTSVSAKPTCLVVGKVQIDEKLREAVAAPAQA
jgi:polynucleotide 5'-hydroxyl-kinase GRC3/NOL9